MGSAFLDVPIRPDLYCNCNIMSINTLLLTHSFEHLVSLVLFRYLVPALRLRLMVMVTVIGAG